MFVLTTLQFLVGRRSRRGYTAKLIQRMTLFNPDSSWHKVLATAPQ